MNAREIKITAKHPYVTLCDVCDCLATIERINGNLVVTPCACVANAKTEEA